MTGARVSPLLPGRGLLAPQAISNAVLWLASDESSEVTGIELPVDAGNLVQPGLNATVLAETSTPRRQNPSGRPEGPAPRYSKSGSVVLAPVITRATRSPGSGR